MPDSAPSTPESAAPAGTPSGADVRPPDVAPGPDAAGRTPQASPRRRARAAIAVGVLLGAAGCGAYRALALNHAESTDKAYVQGNVVQITAQVPGTVVAILADDADSVKAGPAQARPGRCPGGARPGRGSAGADRARGAHPVCQQRHLQRPDHAARGRAGTHPGRSAARAGRRPPPRPAAGQRCGGPGGVRPHHPSWPPAAAPRPVPNRPCWRRARYWRPTKA